jgi:hypothetical protein
VLEHFPESVVPARRKKHTYVSAILSKNEVNRADPYNRKLFLRVRRGQYLINPRMALRVEGEWRDIYDLLVPERLGATLRTLETWMGRTYDPNTYREQAINRLRDLIRSLARGEPLPPRFI